MEQLYTTRETETFRHWIDGLTDRRARLRIDVRIRRLELGNTGDSKALGGGLHELRVHYGKGYRVYWSRQGGRLIVLLCGGDKSSQSRDIAAARKLLAELKEDMKQ
jgi:putative addiction module killer protein